MEINERIICKITGIQSYGVFVEHGAYSGLVHISELSDHYVASIEDLFSIGDEIEALVLKIDDKNKRLKLSYKQAHPMHPRIQKMVKIKKGFHPLAQALPHWVEKALKK